MPLHTALVQSYVSHTFLDGRERPIAFASRTLSTSERNYAQLEKEGLSLVFGVKKFYQYLRIRQKVYACDRSQATHCNLQTQEGNSSLSYSKTTMLGTITVSIQV